MLALSIVSAIIISVLCVVVIHVSNIATNLRESLEKEKLKYRSFDRALRFMVQQFDVSSKEDFKFAKRLMNFLSMSDWYILSEAYKELQSYMLARNQNQKLVIQVKEEINHEKEATSQK